MQVKSRPPPPNSAALVTEKKQTALMFAARAGSAEHVRKIIEAKVQFGASCSCDEVIDE